MTLYSKAFVPKLGACLIIVFEQMSVFFLHHEKHIFSKVVKRCVNFCHGSIAIFKKHKKLPYLSFEDSIYIWF